MCGEFGRLRRRISMARFTLKSALTAAACAGILTAAALPNSVHAAKANWVVSWGRPTVAIDSLGPGRSDQELGIKTHWECQTALDNPNDPFTCTRFLDPGSALPKGV